MVRLIKNCKSNRSGDIVGLILVANIIEARLHVFHFSYVSLPHYFFTSFLIAIFEKKVLP